LLGALQQRGLDGSEVAKDRLARVKARYSASFGFDPEPPDWYAEPPGGDVDRNELGVYRAHGPHFNETGATAKGKEAVKKRELGGQSAVRGFLAEQVRPDALGQGPS
jgi:hypothetical protein